MEIYMKSKNLLKLSGGLALSLVFSGAAIAQNAPVTTTTTTKTEVVQNSDGSYSVIEYPVGKEVSVSLTPYAIKDASGNARVLRTADGTKIWLDLANVTGDTSSFYAYAVDAMGMPTLLGPVMIENGAAKAEFSTPMNQFMLVLSPTEGLSTIDSSTAVVFRSNVPTGYAIVPRGDTLNGKEAKEKQVATTAEVASTYNVPLLNVPSFDNKTTEIRINFNGELQGLKGKAYIDPRKDGATQIKMRFDDMKMAPKEKRFVLWASSPDGKYTKLGQVINSGKRQESEIRSETALKDFGLFVTMEETDVTNPTGKVYSVFSLSE